MDLCCDTRSFSEAKLRATGWHDCNEKSRVSDGAQRAKGCLRSAELYKSPRRCFISPRGLSYFHRLAPEPCKAESWEASLVEESVSLDEGRDEALCRCQSTQVYFFLTAYQIMSIGVVLPPSDHRQSGEKWWRSEMMSRSQPQTSVKPCPWPDGRPRATRPALPPSTLTTAAHSVITSTPDDLSHDLRNHRVHNDRLGHRVKSEMLGHRKQSAAVPAGHCG